MLVKGVIPYFFQGLPWWGTRNDKRVDLQIPQTNTFTQPNIYLIMKPRTLWTITLKIFGLYIFLQVLYALPLIFQAIAFFDGNNAPVSMGMIAQALFLISIYLFLIIAFIFRTDWLINALRLNKGITEEKLELNMHRSTVLKIAIIISGLLLFIESVPLLLRGLFEYYQEMNVFSGFKHYPKGGFVIFQLVKVLISFFMITSSRLIVNFIERKRKGKVNPPETDASAER